MAWNKIVCSSKELQLMGTLDGGQSFRWSLDVVSNTWTGVFSKTVWKLKQENDALLYQVIGTLLQKENDKASAKKTKRYKKSENVADTFGTLLRNYFRLNVKLKDLYEEWANKDDLFRSSCKQFYGVRMLAQEPVENLFSFICSQNNHISRISGMVEKLCQTYGQVICKDEERTYYSFPDVDSLADPKVSDKLRELSFGYRAKFIQQSAAQLVERGGETWLIKARELPYTEARKQLMQLHGIGPKVADCICLMSLGHLEAVPVDTHVYQIAAQHYLHHLRGKKSVTENMYAQIGEHFRLLYGPLAGWAHTVLFCADLKKFQQPIDREAKSTKKTKR